MLDNLKRRHEGCYLHGSLLQLENLISCLMAPEHLEMDQKEEFGY
ncbi:hypothetical protein BVRB_5g105440 [Beta vulgaris subsp. vulgaris]|nr:hypothetical protein BVRB_5g105440 [Beta vulgaris subsp. vulgaris]